MRGRTTSPAYRRSLLMASSLATLLAGSQAAAQTADAGASGAPPVEADAAGPPDASSQDIIVTAQKRSERLRDVPMSITAASSTQLTTLGITQPEALTKLVPGFTVNKTQYGLPVFYIRGVGFNDTAIGVSPAVSVYTDQLPIPYSPMARGAAFDLERVEVLKGPQGTLFGQNSTGGAINFIAAKPTDELKAGFDLTLGRFDQVDAEAFVSGPISDTLSARVAVRNEYRGDWQRGYTIDETLGAKRFQNGRVTVDWRPSSSVKVELLGTGWRDRSDAQQPQFTTYAPQLSGPGANPIPFPVSTFPTAPKDDRAAAWDRDRDFRQNNWFYQVGGRVDVRITDAIDLTSLTSYSEFSQHVVTDFDATDYPVSANTQDGRIRSFSQEVRLSGSALQDGLTWMLGGNYQNDRVLERLISNPFINTSVPIARQFYTDNLQKVSTRSVFGSLDYKLTSTLIVQGSVRYTKQERDFTGCLFDTGDGSAAALFSVLLGRPVAAGSCVSPGADGQAVPSLTNSLDEDNVAWRGSLNWKASDDALVYANVTKGFKSGSFPTIPYINVLQASPVKQEKVLAYEAGTKVSLFDRRLQLDGAVFYYDYRDKQLNGYIVIPPFGATPGLVTIPKTTVNGAEISATIQPLRGLTVTANGTYVDTRIDRGPANPFDFNGRPSNLVGRAFANSPKWQSVADGQYRFSVSPRLGAYLGATLTHHSSTSGVLKSGDPVTDGFVRIPGYALLDLRVGLEALDGSWRLEAWGRNVTNKYYLISTIRASDYYTRFTGMPATYGLSLFFRY